MTLGGTPLHSFQPVGIEITIPFLLLTFTLDQQKMAGISQPVLMYE